MRTLILLAVLVAATAAATEVYRWVDADGQVHYSDQWQPGAERVLLQESSGYNPPSLTTPSTTAEPPVAAQSSYQVLEVASPAQEEVLWNIESQLPVSLQLDPALRPGHELRLFLDGQQQEIPTESMAVTLSGVHRGVHTLRAEVVSEEGEVLITSPTRTFVVRQTSILNPAHPMAPVIQPKAP